MSQTKNFDYPSGLPLTLQDLIINAVDIHADKRMLILEKENYTFNYADIKEIIGKITAKLNHEGIGKGDFICSYSALNTESILLFWASMLQGAIFIPLDFNWPLFLLKTTLYRLKPKLLFCDRDRYGLVSKMNRYQCIVYDSDNDAPANPGDDLFSDWLSGLEEHIGNSILPKINSDDTAVILFTSGTTSEPKGVMLSHGSLTRSGWLVKEAFDFKDDDLLYCIGELNAMSGLRNQCISPLFAGNSILITELADRSNLFAIADSIQRNRCTLLSTAPAVIRQLNQYYYRISNKKLSSLRQVITTGSDLSANVIEIFEKNYSVKLLNYYGLTETTGLCIGIPADHNTEHKGTIGIPIGAQIEIVDGSDTVLDINDIGELRIKSSNLMKGYFKNPELTHKVIKKGWFYTGDLALLRDDNHVVLLGRKNDVIKDAHANLIHPGEIESILETHPQVLEAGVCGYIAETGDEKIAAFIVPETDIINTREFFETLSRFVVKYLGQIKKPSRFVIKNKLPKGSNNKLIRKYLIKELIH